LAKPLVLESQMRKKSMCERLLDYVILHSADIATVASLLVICQIYQHFSESQIGKKNSDVLNYSLFMVVISI